MKVKFHYKDGSSETISDVNGLLDLGNGEFCYYINRCFTRYHALNVESVEEIEVAHEG